MRAIHAARIEDRAMRRVIDDLKAALLDHEKEIAALKSKQAVSTQSTTTIIERESTSTTATVTAELDELTAAPYPPRFELEKSDRVEPGMFVGWPAATASIPGGWLLCDGTSYATADYPDLFSVIGYTWGGAGANFNVPNFSDRYLQGVGGGEVLADVFGANNAGIPHELDFTHSHGPGTLGTSTDGAHTHGGATGAPSATTNVTAGTVAVASDTHTHTISSDGSHSHTVTTGTTANGLTTAKDIRPRSVAVYWIIKT